MDSIALASSQVYQAFIVAVSNLTHSVLAEDKLSDYSLMVQTVAFAAIGALVQLFWL
jgi:hypothetical protein